MKSLDITEYILKILERFSLGRSQKRLPWSMRKSLAHPPASKRCTTLRSCRTLWQFVKYSHMIHTIVLHSALLSCFLSLPCVPTVGACRWKSHWASCQRFSWTGWAPWLSQSGNSGKQSAAAVTPAAVLWFAVFFCHKGVWRTLGVVASTMSGEHVKGQAARQFFFQACDMETHEIQNDWICLVGQKQSWCCCPSSALKNRKR
jgi:hypothetical protein